MLNESQLNDLIARFGDDYNRPQGDPPLQAVRERVHRVRAARRRTSWFPFAIAAAALIAIIASGSRAANLDRTVAVSPRQGAVGSTFEFPDSRARAANAALTSAVESAEAAARTHPSESWYEDHLVSMRENAEEFHLLQRQLVEAL